LLQGCIGKYLCEAFPILNVLEQGDALERAIKKVQENSDGLKLVEMN